MWLTAVTTVEVKKYTESHEWVELADNNIGKSTCSRRNGMPDRIAHEVSYSSHADFSICSFAGERESG